MEAVRVTSTSRAPEGFPRATPEVPLAAPPRPGTGAETGPEVAVGLGANVGAPLLQLRAAVEALVRAGLRPSAVSSVYRSAPEGYAHQPDFLNAVVVGRWPGGVDTLLDVARGIEDEAGRDRPFPNAPRTLDLDLILAPGIRRDGPTLVLPHPRWRERGFVLAPLAEVAPHWTDPLSGETVQEIWDRQRARMAPVTPVAPPDVLWSPNA